MLRRHLLISLLPAVLALRTRPSLAAPSAAGIAAYPTAPVRVIVPFAPGAGNDILSRRIGQHMSDVLKQPFVIDNRDGAGGLIGCGMIARAAPDGYTIGMGSTSTMAIAPARMKQPPFDPVADFAPVTLIGSDPYVLVVNPSLPVQTLAELIAYAKAHPGALKFSSAGIGATNHLAGEIFKTMAGVSMVHVPYRGAGPATVAVMSNVVPLSFAPVLTAIPYVRSGQLRALAVTSAKRSVAAPELPTVAEAALPGYEVSNWYGILAPRGTPQPIVTRLNQEIVRYLKSDEITEELTREGAQVIASTPEEFATYIASEIVKWKQVIKDANVPTE